MIIYSISSARNIQACLYTFAFRNKYDLSANALVKEIFQAITNEQSIFNKSLPEYQLEVEVDIKTTELEHIEKIKDRYFVPFDVNSYNDAQFPKEQFQSAKIIINVLLSKSFSEQNYETLYYKLYEIVRHELEHRQTYITLGKPTKKYNRLYNKVFNLSPTTTLKKLEQHCQLISQYLIHPQELSSYARSIFYNSKKQHKDFHIVLEKVLNRTFYNDDPELIKIALNDPEIIKIVNTTRTTIIQKINEIFPNSMIRTRFL